MAIRSGFRRGLSFLLAICAWSIHAPIGAQQSEPVGQHERPSIREALEVWQAGDPGGRRLIGKVLRNAGRYPAATVDSAVAGVEHLALTAEDPLLRHAAASTMLSAGSGIFATPPVSGLVARAASVYAASADPVVRGIIITRMYEQAERGQAMEFLKTVVTEGDPLTGGFPQSAVHAAMDALNHIGESGRAALRELHERGGIRGAGALGYLEYLGIIPEQDS